MGKAASNTDVLRSGQVRWGWLRLILVPLAGSAVVAGVLALALTASAEQSVATLLPGLPAALAALVWVLSAALLFLHQRNRRMRAERLAADLDPLTGVLNRGALTTRITRIFTSRERKRRDVGIFFIDVDSFKQVNDQHGHDFGDQYLRHIAWQVTAHVRKDDLVGRMGGDEFVAILPGIDRDLLRTIADRLVEAVKEPFVYQGKKIQGGISIGCHLSPAGEAPTAALDLADGAAYQAKMLGRGRVVEFTGALAKARERRERLISAIVRAVEDGDFDIHYQPVYAVADGRLIGFEALMRLTMPGGAPVNPVEIVPLAESTGLIIPLGTEIMRRALRLAAQWPGDLHLSVNVSPAEFQSGTFPEQVLRLLDEEGVDPELLMLEVTERIVSDGGDRVVEQLAELRAAGVTVAMDDFGAGPANLGHLWTHRFDQIKVDGALQEAFSYDPGRYRPLFEVIADLGRRLSMPVTLKGIECARHAGLAQELGCAAYQGTWLSRPLPAAETLNLVGQTARDSAGGPPGGA